MKKIDINEYRKLLDESITKKEYENIINKINDRFDYIIRKIATNFVWWDYDNLYPNRDGWFNPESYNEDEYINFAGEFSMPKPYNDETIPIRWLWEDFEEEFENDVKKYREDEQKRKQTQKQKKLDLQKKKDEMKMVITAKLTKEELKYVKFK